MNFVEIIAPDKENLNNINDKCPKAMRSPL